MATKNWTGAINTLWTTAGNWNPAVTPILTDDLVFNNSANSNVNGSYTFNSIDFNGYTGTLSGTQAMFISGSTTGTSTGISLRLSSGMTITYNGAINFTGASGGYVYSNGKSLLSALTFNNAAGVWSNQDALTTSTTIILTTGSLITGAPITAGGLFTFTAGTLNLGSFTHSLFSFNSSNINNRTLNFGTSTVNLTGNNATLFTTSTSTNLTVLGTDPTINLTYSGSVGTRVIVFGTTLSEANSISTNITSGSDSIIFSNGFFKSINFTGFSGTGSVLGTIYKDLTLSPTQTFTAAGNLFFTGTSTTQSLISNGVNASITALSINSSTTTVQNIGPLTITGQLILTTGSFTTNGNLNIGTQITLTAGSFSVNNNANVTTGLFISSNSNVRTLNMGSGTWTLTSTGTIWSLNTSTNMTLNAGTSRILITDTGSALVTFNGGSLTYYTLEVARGSSTGSVSFNGNNTFINFIDITSAASHSLTFALSTTTTFHRFNVKGTPGNLITLTTTTGVNPYSFAKSGSGVVNCDYLNIAHSIASPANTWYAGVNSVNSQSVSVAGSGWNFTTPSSSRSTLGSLGVG